MDTCCPSCSHTHVKQSDAVDDVTVCNFLKSCHRRAVARFGTVALVQSSGEM